MSNVRTWLAEKSEEEREQFLGEAPRLCLEGGRIQKLCRLLRDFDFIEAKINHPQLGLQRLIDDYELINDLRILNHPDYNLEKAKVLKLIQGGLRLSAHILAEDKTQLAAQLWGRLQGFERTDIQALLRQCKQRQVSPWLQPQTPSLTPPDGRLVSTLIGHDGWITSVAVTPDRKQLISGSSDNTVKVWNLTTGAEILTFTGHSAPVNTVAITPDGKRVISGSSDNTVKVWNLTTGAEILTFTGHSSPVTSVAITFDGKRVISASIVDPIKVWDLESGKEEFTLIGHTDLIRSVTVTSFNCMISASDDSTIIGWDLEEGKKLFWLSNDPYPNSEESSPRKVYVIAVSSDSKWLFFDYDEIINVWNLETQEAAFLLRGHSDSIVTLAVTPDGKRLISASLDKTLKVWDLKSGKELFSLNGHNELICALTITSDSKQIICGSKDKTIKVWNLDLKSEDFNFTIYNKPVTTLATTSN
ncbi:hypothetical protein GNF10_35520, partial [Nostoc sp. UCD121]|nr:hypothetical protein [Nostoc sp. UCD121]